MAQETERLGKVPRGKSVGAEPGVDKGNRTFNPAVAQVTKICRNWWDVNMPLYISTLEERLGR